MIAFTVPGEPVGKGRPRFVRATGRTYTPPRTANYESRITEAAASAMIGRDLFEGPLRVTIRATFIVPQSWSQKRKREAVWKTSKPDADNLAKIIDSLNGIVFHDDAQVVDLTGQKRYAPKAEMIICVEPLSTKVGVE